MNWTGGRLSRHSAAANSARAKQREHFAKVKKNLRSNNTTRSPVKWSILNHIVEEDTGCHWRMPSIEPSIVPNHDGIRHVSLNKTLSTRTTDVNYASPYQSGHIERLPIEREHTQDRNQIRKSLTGKRKREEEDAYDAQYEENNHRAIIDRRKRLLRIGDWVGASSLLPAKHSFIPAATDENIGQRRKLSDSERPSFNVHQSHITSLFRSRPPTGKGMNTGAQGGGRHLKTDIKIFIGSSLETSLPSSNARQFTDDLSKLTESSATQFNQSNSSNIMLFDEDNSSRMTRKSLLSPTNNKALSSRNSCVSNLSFPWVQDPRDHRQPISSSYVHSNLGNYWSNYSHKPISPMPGSRGAQRKDSNRIEMRTLTSNTALTPISALRYRALQNGPTCSSSSAQLQHPMPQSFRKFAHMDSSSDVIAESNAARIGHSKMAMTEAHCADNIIWKAWFTADSNAGYPVNGAHNIKGEYNSRHTEISPGVSALWYPRNDNMDLPILPSRLLKSLHQKSTCSDGSSVISGHSTAEEYGDGTLGGAYVRQMQSSGGVSMVVSDVVEQNGKSSPSSPSLIRNAQDDLWRKFVFGTEDKDDENTAEYSRKVTMMKVTKRANSLSSRMPQASSAEQHAMSRSTSSRWSVVEVNSTPLSAFKRARILQSSNEEIEGAIQFFDSGSDGYSTTDLTMLGMDRTSVQGARGTTASNSTRLS